MPLYSDSANAISWVKQKKCKTKLPRTSETEYLFELIERAEKMAQKTSIPPYPKMGNQRMGRNTC